VETAGKKAQVQQDVAAVFKRRFDCLPQRLPVFRRRFGCLSYQNTVNRGWDKQPANYQPIKSFLKYLWFEGNRQYTVKPVMKGWLKYSGLNLNQDKATKPQTVQIVRQGNLTPYWFKVNPL